MKEMRGPCTNKVCIHGGVKLLFTERVSVTSGNILSDASLIPSPLFSSLPSMAQRGVTVINGLLYG